jgi:hypothetical protein
VQDELDVQGLDSGGEDDDDGGRQAIGFVPGADYLASAALDYSEQFFMELDVDDNCGGVAADGDRDREHGILCRKLRKKLHHICRLEERACSESAELNDSQREKLASKADVIAQMER